jgi:hypothetical protein
MTVQKDKTGPGTLTIGDVGSEVDFSAQVLSAVVEWDKDKEDDRKVLSGETVAGSTKRSATVTVSILNDVALLTGIVQFSWANKGEEHDFTFIPNTAADQQITGTVTVEPISIGGDVDSDMESEFEWDFVGEPVLAPVV